MKRIVVTGSSGFVGQHFIKWLEQSELIYEVLGLDMAPPPTHCPYTYIKVTYQQVDLLNREVIETALDEFDPDYILHLASSSSVASSWIDPVSSFQNNTNIFINLIESVRQLKLNCRILSVGSSEVYGNINESPLTEDSKIDPISPYAVARISQEMLSTIYAKSYGVNIIMTRSFNHIGVNQNDQFVVSSFAKQIHDISKTESKSGTIKTGNLNIVRDFTDVRDVVWAYYILLINGQIGRVYNVCSGIGYTLGDIISELADLTRTNITTNIDATRIRPSDNLVIVGCNHRMQSEFSWNPVIPIRKSLTDILDSYN